MALMTGLAFSPTLQHKMISSIQQSVKQSMQQMHASVKKNTPPSVASRIPDFEYLTDTDVRRTNANENADGEGGVPSVSSSKNEYVIDDRHYVLIEGKYYLAREDNTYMVNGRKLFFVDNRRYKMDPKDNSWRLAQNDALPTNESDKDAANKAPSKDNSDALTMPTSPAEMMKVLNRAQQQMKERNKALEEIK